MTICKEQFDLEFEAFCDAMDIDITCNTDEERTDLEQIKYRLHRAADKGKLRFDDEHRPIVTTVDGVELVFNESDGANVKGTDSKKEGELVAKTFVLMAGMTKTHPSTFAKMKYRDLKICQDLLRLFMVA